MHNKPYQFVGYWGYGERQELEKLLTQVLNAALPHWGKAKRLGCQTNPLLINSNCVGNIAYLGSDCERYADVADIKEGLIASISAGGLKDSPDAWVRVKRDERLILGREPFGRVPLYWTQQGGVIWFASRLQLLLPVVNPHHISLPGLYGYSCFSYVPTPLTPVVDIFAVPAGRELVWQAEVGERGQGGDGENFQIQSLKCQTQNRYEWREASVLLGDEEEAIVQLQTLLKDAIGRQIAGLPTEPVGVFLSGGIDSSVVAALLVQAGVKVRAYTLDFGDEGKPEWPYAEQVAQFLNIPLVKVDARPHKIKKALAATVSALDLPFGDGVTVPLYLLCQAASQDTTVIFNGEGGDQLFAGWTNKPLIAAGIYNTEHPAGVEDFNQHYLRTFHRLWGYEARVYQLNVYRQVQVINPQDWIQEALDSSFCSGLLHRLRRATLMLKGAQNIHPRATNLAFAHGLVVRSPFCDLPLAEWTFHLSGELYLRSSCEKYILKRAVESWLPPEIVWREKRGMGVPLTPWCLTHLWSELGNWLNPGLLRSQGHFIPELPLKVITGELGGQIRGRRIGEILWLLLMWQAWRATVLGESSNKKDLYHPFLFPYQWWKWLDKIQKYILANEN